MSAYSSALCSLILFKQFLLIRQRMNKHFLLKCQNLHFAVQYV